MAAVWDEWISDGVDELRKALVRIFTESANPETHDCAKDTPILQRSFTVPSPQGCADDHGAWGWKRGGSVVMITRGVRVDINFELDEKGVEHWVEEWLVMSWLNPSADLNLPANALDAHSLTLRHTKCLYLQAHATVSLTAGRYSRGDDYFSTNCWSIPISRSAKTFSRARIMGLVLCGWDWSLGNVEGWASWASLQFCAGGCTGG
ncbi:hypothetical protein PILCRDRAFT_91743 [Piloderma croceum F 1598]|uniref:Uncharacterized protein n=1 Tax=Piloderma croceum (strain F 1598) TaxID=765440 RepID=A0A0C3F8U2_PILCF|nr:hypothetical protein PILCRDRAFT_91743 [Piloderma croceum F 1598]